MAETLSLPVAVVDSCSVTDVEGRTAALVSLLRHRGYWCWSAAVQLARLPSTMAPLGFTLLTTAITGSYRLGAAMMVAFVVGELAGAMLCGRLLDVTGPGRRLPVLLLSAAAAVIVAALAAGFGAPPWALLALATVCGAANGGLPGGFRAVLADVVSDRLILKAVSVDAMVLEGIIIAGPVLVALSARAGPVAPLIAMAGAFAVSAVALPHRRFRSRPPTTAIARVPLPWRDILPWLGCVFAIGHLLSTIEVASLPLAGRVGGGAVTATILIAVLSGASIVGGAVFTWRGTATLAVALSCLGCFVVGGVLIALGSGWLSLLPGLTLVGGCTAPLLSVASGRLQRLLPERRRAEGFSASYIVQSVGFGLGALTLGVLPLRVAELIGMSSALLTGTVLLRRRGSQADGR
jgi:hypothetical protein